jgi:hypothetical protein
MKVSYRPLGKVRDKERDCDEFDHKKMDIFPV